MIAMQYTIPLPADYDMEIIDRRIREKGSLLNGFPHLRFKAYLSARKQSGDASHPQNLYAPFYLWDDTEGLNEFLCGQGFAVLSNDFGRPIVQTWSTWHVDLGSNLRQARFATRSLTRIDSADNLAHLREVVRGQARQATESGAIAAVSAFEPTDWTVLHFQLWDTLPAQISGRELYDVGYVALP